MAGAQVVRSLAISLGVEIRNLHAAQRFHDRIEAIKSGMQAMSSAARTAAKVMTGLGVGLVALTAKTAKTAGELNRMAAGLGMSIDGMQALSFAYQNLGVDQAEMVDSFQKLSDRIEKAAGGSKEYARALAMVGIRAQDVIDQPLAVTYDQVLRGVISLDSEQKRLAATTGIFGETLARKLSPALANNGELLREYVAISREANVVMSAEGVKALTQLDLSYTRLKAILIGVKNQLSVALAPHLNRVTKQIWDWYAANKEIIGQRIDRTAERIADAFKTVEVVFGQVTRALEPFGGWFGTANKIVSAFAAMLVGKFAVGATTALSGLLSLGSSVAAIFSSKLVAIVTAVTVVVGLMALAIDELWGVTRGAESIFDSLRERFSELGPVLQTLVFAVTAVRAAWGAVFDLLKSVALPTLIKLKPLLQAIGIAVLAVGAALAILAAGFVVIPTILVMILGEIVQFLQIWKAAWTATVRRVFSVFSGAVDVAKDAWDGFVEMLKDIPNPFAAIEKGAKRLGRMVGRKSAQPAESTQASASQVARQAFAGTYVPPTAESLTEQMYIDSLARRAATHATRNSSETNVQLQQQVNITVQGTMDDRVGKRVAAGVSSAGSAAANSINNAARTGNR